MLMKEMEEVGRETLLKAVDIANRQGNPSYDKVKEILCLPQNQTDVDTNAVDIGILNDEFYVEQRDPMTYVSRIHDDT